MVTKNTQPPNRIAITGGFYIIAVINAVVIIIIMIFQKTNTSP